MPAGMPRPVQQQNLKLTQAVKAEARRLGFVLAGVTTPEPTPHLADFEAWLAAGKHGEMAYLAGERARQRRADPLKIMPACRSILVLGMRYPAHLAAPANENTSLAGKVAAYAWGLDYHDVLPERMQRLATFIEEQAGRSVEARWYTDTGPILERDLAQRAGLGWIGKNTGLIHPRQGSYFFLAEMLVDIELALDEPFRQDHCGTCRRCLEACPSGCILPDRSIDAAGCISYLTIELKGTIPLAQRPQIGTWIFGCDVCQQVCPWNQHFSTAEHDPAFAPRAGLPAPNLMRELMLTPQEFKEKFKGSPILRTKRRGYLRNVAVALGNTGSRLAVPALMQTLRQETEPLVRGHAAWALGRIGGPEARLALEQALPGEQNEEVRQEIELALG